MFDPQKEVPSLELCKRLKELGYPQDGGGWYWVKRKYDLLWGLYLKFQKGWVEWVSWDNNNIKCYWDTSTDIRYDNAQGVSILRIDELIKAPTCRELGERLPKLVLNKYSLYYTQVKDGWIIDYANSSNPANDRLNWEVDCTEPNVRAEMIIWLKENGYIDFKEK
ncbi:MAG: hypothetical protein DRP08_03955 [Candidatus Aenigmatarchaeota archaeon]|nr:MAG: hypothetical protein DRP08_03955 [Candidatus Aenigmarchaeota archaeon]